MTNCLQGVCVCVCCDGYGICVYVCVCVFRVLHVARETSTSQQPTAHTAWLLLGLVHVCLHECQLLQPRWSRQIQQTKHGERVTNLAKEGNCCGVSVVGVVCWLLLG